MPRRWLPGVRGSTALAITPRGLGPHPSRRHPRLPSHLAGLVQGSWEAGSPWGWSPCPRTPQSSCLVPTPAKQSYRQPAHLHLQDSVIGHRSQLLSLGKQDPEEEAACSSASSPQIQTSPRARGTEEAQSPSHAPHCDYPQGPLSEWEWLPSYTSPGMRPRSPKGHPRRGSRHPLAPGWPRCPQPHWRPLTPSQPWPFPLSAADPGQQPSVLLPSQRARPISRDLGGSKFLLIAQGAPETQHYLGSPWERPDPAPVMGVATGAWLESPRGR